MESYSQSASPTAGSSPDSTYNTSIMTNKSAENNKSSKRKGTRSVSTLTPSQLARKRANDREAQRAIRARTKEHIENLERELEELRSHQGRDKTVQDLLRRNKALEEELRRLQESMGLPNTTQNGMYQPSYHDANSRASSYGQQPSPGLSVIDSGLPPYGHMGDSGEHWSSHVPCSLPSAVSSPASSGAGDDFGNNNYFPTSAPSAVLERTSMPPGMNSPTSSVVSGKVGFEDLKSEYGVSQINVVPITSAYHQQASWNVYPMYYPASPATM